MAQNETSSFGLAHHCSEMISWQSTCLLRSSPMRDIVIFFLPIVQIRSICDKHNTRTHTIRYDHTRCYFNVRSKADISQLNLLVVNCVEHLR